MAAAESDSERVAVARRTTAGRRECPPEIAPVAEPNPRALPPSAVASAAAAAQPAVVAAETAAAVVVVAVVVVVVVVAAAAAVLPLQHAPD